MGHIWVYNGYICYIMGIYIYVVYTHIIYPHYMIYTHISTPLDPILAPPGHPHSTAILGSSRRRMQRGPPGDFDGFPPPQSPGAIRAPGIDRGTR